MRKSGLMPFAVLAFHAFDILKGQETAKQINIIVSNIDAIINPPHISILYFKEIVKYMEQIS